VLSGSNRIRGLAASSISDEAAAPRSYEDGPIFGLARVVAAAPALALAIGYDVEAAFEEPDG
jgi:hypothetical protein